VFSPCGAHVVLWWCDGPKKLCGCNRVCGQVSHTHSETTALWIPPKPGLLVSSCSNITGHGFTGDWTHAMLRSKNMYHFKAVTFYFLPSATWLWLLLRLSHRDVFLTPIGAWVTLMRERKPGIPTRRWRWWSLAWVMPSQKGAWGEILQTCFWLRYLEV